LETTLRDIGALSCFRSRRFAGLASRTSLLGPLYFRRRYEKSAAKARAAASPMKM